MVSNEGGLVPEVKLSLLEKNNELFSLARPPTPEERRALEGTGLTFFQIGVESLGELHVKNANHFGHVDNLNTLRTYTLPMIVGINLAEPFIPGSFKKPKTAQLAMLEGRSLDRQRKFPYAREVMLSASALAQLDIALFRNTGGKERLFNNNSFACASDPAAVNSLVVVGRFRPANGLYVSVWNTVYGDFDDVGALSAVVFIRK